MPEDWTAHDAPTPFWKIRNPNDGSGFQGVRMFEKPEELWQAACAYFEWVEENPLIEEKVFHNQGIIVRTNVTKMRAMTLQGLCFFLGISRDTWHKWSKDRPDLVGAIAMIRDVIYEQKFTGAAADLLNATVISKDLGLRDVREITGPGGGPVNLIHSEMTPQEAMAAYASMLQSDEE